VIAVRNLAASLFLLCALAPIGACRAQEATVVLKARAELAGATFQLGDIAEVRSTDPRLANELREIPVGKTPRIGYTQSVRRDDLADLLARRDPRWRAALAWSGATAVNVVAIGGQQIDTGALIDAAAQALRSAIGDRYASLRISPVGTLDALTVPTGIWQAVTQVVAGTGVTVAKRMSVLVHISVNGQPYRTIPLWFTVEANRSVAVADADMPAGESLRPEKFSSRVVDVTQLAADPVLPESIAPTMRLRQPLARGALLLGSHVEARPHVTRHQSVEIKVVSGPIRIETTGVALTDGRIGELVRVRNPASKEPPFSARVVDDGVVLIQAR
jgi:flagella basal body P-ring formation protein FlgA